MKISLVGVGAQSFLDELNREGVKYSQRTNFSAAPVNGPDAIVILGQIEGVLQHVVEGIPWGALAVATIKWFASRPNAEVIIVKGTDEIHLKGRSAEEIEKLYQIANRVSAFDAKGPKKESLGDSKGRRS